MMITGFIIQSRGGGMPAGKYVYRNKQCWNKICGFYDTTLAALNVPYIILIDQQIRIYTYDI